MAERIRKTQEEEIVNVLQKEGFKELSEDEIKKPPYKSIYVFPDCIKGQTASGNDEK
jgi:hypothetical protein